MNQPTINDVAKYEAMMECGKLCCRNVMWKSSTQMFKINMPMWATNLGSQVRNGTYKSKGFTNFIINERGKIRHIQAVHISERCVQKSLCMKALKPIITPCLIYDNGASLEDKGIDFAVKRLRKHLTQHYKKYGLQGGILITDYHDYFNSIDHKILLDMYRKKIKDDDVYKLTEYFISQFKGDKGLGLGSEVSQISAIFYLNELDHYIKEKLHIKQYARYMDDSYLIHHDIHYLKYCLNVMKELSSRLGLTYNEKHTYIVPFATGNFTYLKRRFFLTNTGKIVMRIDPKTITKNRQLLKKQFKLLQQGKIELESIFQSYQSRLSYFKKCRTYYSRLNLEKLYSDLLKSTLYNMSQ
jgi:hypothetical protein